MTFSLPTNLLIYQDPTLLFILSFIVVLFAIFVIKTYINLKIDSRRTQASQTEVKWMDDIEKGSLRQFNLFMQGEADGNVTDGVNSEEK